VELLPPTAFMFGRGGVPLVHDADTTHDTVVSTLTKIPSDLRKEKGMTSAAEELLFIRNQLKEYQDTKCKLRYLIYPTSYICRNYDFVNVSLIGKQNKTNRNCRSGLRKLTSTK
jgi:hypothetical protein